MTADAETEPERKARALVALLDDPDPLVALLAFQGRCRHFDRMGMPCEYQPLAGKTQCGMHPEERPPDEDAALRLVAELNVLGARVNMLRAVLESMDHGYVYRIGYGNAWKIGYSTDPHARLATLRRTGEQTLSPPGVDRGRLELVATIPGTIKTERAIHASLGRRRRMVGEWYRITDAEGESLLIVAGLGRTPRG